MAETKFIAVLYDPREKRLLRGGRWVSFDEFARNPPQRLEDIASPQGDNVEVVHDPSGSYPCIDGVLYFCFGGSCRQVPDPATGVPPLACP